MSDLIRRNDCDLFNPSLGTDEMLWDEVNSFHLTAREHVYEDDLYEFARKILQRAQNVIDTAPTISTDTYVAFKCPECKNIYIEYNDPDNSFCPVCGVGRK